MKIYHIFLTWVTYFHRNNKEERKNGHRKVADKGHRKVADKGHRNSSYADFLRWSTNPPLENRKSFQQWCCWVTAGRVIGNGVMPLNCWVRLRTPVRKPRQRMAGNASLGYAARHGCKAKQHSLGVSGLSAPLSKAELENSKVTLLNKPALASTFSTHGRRSVRKWQLLMLSIQVISTVHHFHTYTNTFTNSLNWYSYKDAKALKYFQV